WARQGRQRSDTRPWGPRHGVPSGARWASAYAGRVGAEPREIEVQLRALGIRQGGVLVAHTSFRAVRPVEGGPTGLIEALRAAIGRVHELDGPVLLLGVGHDANTTIHLAELLAGVPYGVPRHCTVVQDGRPVRLDYLENDHCCERFAQVDDWLQERGLQSEGR